MFARLIYSCVSFELIGLISGRDVFGTQMTKAYIAKKSGSGVTIILKFLRL